MARMQAGLLDEMVMNCWKLLVWIKQVGEVKVAKIVEFLGKDSTKAKVGIWG